MHIKTKDTELEKASCEFLCKHENKNIGVYQIIYEIN
jgi:hypothetical protein